MSSFDLNILYVALIGGLSFLALIIVRVVYMLWRIRQGRCSWAGSLPGGQGRGGQRSSAKNMSGMDPQRQYHGLVNVSNPNRPLRTLIVLGSGGHTTEMLVMTKQLNPLYYAPIEYCKASTDSTSIMRLHHYKQNKTTITSSSSSLTTANETTDEKKTKNNNSPNLVVHDIPRSREVGQSYLSSIISTLYAQIYAFLLIVRFRPDLVLCNGPGTCLPLCVAAFVCRMVRWCPGMVVFCESYCRVQSLSLTGKILYYWADVFVVHWDELHERYPLTQQIHTFVPPHTG